MDGITTNPVFDKINEITSSIKADAAKNPVWGDFANKQLEYAESFKQQVDAILKQVEQNQTDIHSLSVLVNELRGCNSTEVVISDKDTAQKIKAAVERLCPNSGISFAQEGDGLKISCSGSLDKTTADLNAAIESVSSHIQNDMVSAQDYMGRYSSYLQGASKTAAGEQLSTIARNM